MTAGLADKFRHVFLAVGKAADQLMIALGLLDRAEIGALDVFDQRDFGAVGVVEIADYRGNAVQLRTLRCAPAPFAGYNLEAVARWAKHNWLKHSLFGDRLGKLIERDGVEMTSGLVRMRADLRDVHFADACGRRIELIGSGRSHCFVEQS